MLETTQYNYKELSKMYKEQTQIGFSKIQLLDIKIINTLKRCEVEIMIPPLMSSTMSREEILGNKNQNVGSASQKIIRKVNQGRPEKADDQKSEKNYSK